MRGRGLDARGRAALLAGGLTGFVAAVHLARGVRLDLLLDPEPSWAPARLLLTLGVVAGSVGACVLTAGLVWRASRSTFFGRSMESLPLSRGALLGILAAALLAGLLLRAVWLEEIPWPLWVDDLSMIDPALALRGTWSDFADSIRAAPYGVSRPYGTVGVLYLEAYRLCLILWGTTVFGVRFLPMLAGVLSLATAGLLGRALLPRGGGTLAALILAGLRWSLILSRWGWVSIALVPLADLSALLLLRARRRESPATGAVAGLLAGTMAHVYLSGWIVLAALGLFALWPSRAGTPLRRRVAVAALFVAGLLVSIAPLFLFREGRTVPYFVRTGGHNLVKEVRSGRSGSPLTVAADGLAAPWFTPDPFARHDIPGRSRLGWILGLPVAAIASRSLFFPRDDLSAFLISHAAAALAGTIAGGQAGSPNGFRYGYLTSVTAIAAAGGTLWLLRFLPESRRRLGGLAAVGLLALAGLLGARDCLLRWGSSRETFDAFYGGDSLVGSAAVRWEREGRVWVSPELRQATEHARLTIDAIRRYRLEPARTRRDVIFGPPDPGAGDREFRIVPPGSSRSGERTVERLRDAWGREWGVVTGRRSGVETGR